LKRHTKDGSVVFNFKVRPAIAKDIVPLARNIRPEDAREIAVFGHTPAYGFGFGWELSDPAYTVTLEGRPVAMFGVVPLSAPGHGIVWFLGTPDLEKPVNRIRFLRESSKWVDNLMEKYEKIINYVDARNVLHISWLKWLKFEFMDEKEFNGVRFYGFCKERN
jgi:hypothetical protein